QVIDTQAVRQLTDIMSDNNARAYVFGENNSLTLPDRPVAAKTGTTNDWHDGWTLGFTPSLVTGVWAGNNNNKAMARGADGVLVAAPIWHNFMARALSGKPVEGFTAPDPYPTDIKPILVGQGMGEITLAINKVNNKIATSSTPPGLIEYRRYRQPHSILYYLNKDDIKGPTPPDTTDPQFASWEAGVQAWAAKQQGQFDMVPTEYDDGSTANLILPQIKLNNLIQNQTITNRTLPVSVELIDGSDIKRVVYFIDNVQVEEIQTLPFNTTLYLFDLSRGFHNLKARAYTSNGITAETNVDFNLTAAMEPPTFSWIFPTNNSSFFTSQFPISLKIKAYQIEKIKKIELILEEMGKSKVLASVSDPTEQTLMFTWSKAPAPGNYLLQSNITTIDDLVVPGPNLQIEVQ
ncbi:MAG: hypothetical protein NTU97_00805, partial [Candidatus Magasanikbacteria bacterium]|nr:hypothetical protein [Candidatus Magasanikbacteria bacterium]